MGGGIAEPGFTRDHSAMAAAFEKLAQLSPVPTGSTRRPDVLFVAIRGWSTRYLGWRFRASFPGRSTAARQAIFEDAVQHLLESVLRGDVRSFRESEVPAFIEWCKRVLANFVTGEFRRQKQRELPFPTSDQQPADPESSLEKRELVEVLILQLRMRVANSGRRQDVRRRLALLDEFFGLALGIERRQAELSSRCRRYKRMSRGRQLASKAWAALVGSGSRTEDLTEVASALGLTSIRA
jgi:hypothetical protein